LLKVWKSANLWKAAASSTGTFERKAGYETGAADTEESTIRLASAGQSAINQIPNKGASSELFATTHQSLMNANGTSVCRRVVQQEAL